LPWFRWRKRKQEDSAAPEAAAPEAQAPPVEVERKPPAEAGAEAPKKRRRRGSRGGRGRRKPARQAAGTEPAAQAKPEPRRQPERRPSRSSRGQRRRTPTRRAPLPKAKRELLIAADVGEQRAAVLEDDRVAEVYLERPDRRSIAGNIYKGKVDNVLPGMEAAFVEMGLERNGFLFVDEIVVPELEGRDHGRKIQDLIKRGQEMLVQAVKDPMKSKGARLTTEISLPGRFVVFVPQGDGFGVSRRLEDAERTRLRDILKKLDLKSGGVIVRTAAEGASAEDIQRDLVFLQRLWETIEKRANEVKAPALAYQEAELPLRVVRDLFTEDFERALIEDERTFKRVTGYLKKTSPHMVERVTRDRGKEPLFERYGVDEEIRSTLSRRVELPSGGSLVFDYAEAFTVIDVNTGRFTGSRSKGSSARLEDTITKNNLEAVKEVVRQLRLRDIGGIIVIDFIDMANPKNSAAVEEALKTELERDRTKTFVVEISPLGLVEMTRQNVTDGPREILTESCETCGGAGVLVSPESAAIEVERKLLALARRSRSQGFKVEVNPRTASLVVGPGAERLREIEEQAHRRFWLVSRKDVPPEHFAVLQQGSRAKLAPEAPFQEGAEKRVELVEIGLYDSSAAVGRVDGRAIVVGDAAPLVGKRVRVRIERILDGVAYGSLIAGKKDRAPAPITAEAEAEKPTRTTRSRRSPAEEKKAEPKPEAEAKPEPEAKAKPEPAAAEEAPKPRRKTRRGSRGGRRRRKKPAAAGSENGAAASQATIHVPEPDLGRADAASQDGKAPEQPSDGPAKPRRKTRRGSRGGRGRRKKATTAAGASASQTQKNQQEA